MRTKTSTKQKSTQRRSRIPKKGARKSIENRDLNIDDNTTNAFREEESTEKRVNDVTVPSDRSVEEEDDREQKRKIADSNPADDIQN